MKKLICSIVLCMSLVAAGSGFFVGGGDFTSDGSVPMTGNLNMNGNNIDSAGTASIDGALYSGPTSGTTGSIRIGLTPVGTGTHNTIGGLAGPTGLTSAQRLTLWGNEAGVNLTSGSELACVGFRSCKGITTGEAVVAVGNSSLDGAGADTDNTTALGAESGSQSNVNKGIFIGWRVAQGHQGDTCLAIGTNPGSGSHFTSTSATQEAVFGSRNDPYLNFYFGHGGQTADFAGGTVTLHGSNASGANLAGADLAFAGSRSTGSALGGSLLFQTAIAGGAGSSLNALSTRIEITQAGVTKVSGDLAFQANGQGVVLVAPDAGCWELQVDNAGALTTGSVTCP